MTCERIRWLLSIDPTGRALAGSPAAQRHLDGCPACRAFARALAIVEEDLAARPLARPRPTLALDVQRAAQRWPQPRELQQPFSRAFWLFSAAVTLFALVGGALLLQHAAAAWPPANAAARLWLDPSWPSAASAWLSYEAERAGQAILAALAGLIISAVAAAAGLKAHDHQAARHEQIERTRPHGSQRR
jgi:predicted anti-sigma-YlaC factor YlaD